MIKKDKKLEEAYTWATEALHKLFFIKRKKCKKN